MFTVTTIRSTGYPALIKAVASIAAVFLASAASQAAEDNSTVLEEVVVTALKRGGQTNLAEIAAGLSVISGDEIEDLGADSLTDFLQLAPGVSIDVSPGGGGTTAIGIRGVTTTFGSASVGFYLDDLPFSFISFNVLPDPDPYDLYSVEVLKGPQGTLYGAGSSGGVVLIRTNDPVLNEDSGKIDLDTSYTDDGSFNYSGSGAIGITLIEDKLALRASVSYRDNSGWIDDTVDPTVTDINDEQNLSGRFKLLAALSEDFSLLMSAHLSRVDVGFFQPVADDAMTFPATFRGPGAIRSFDIGGDTNYNLLGAVADYHTSWVDFKNALSYMDFESSYTQSGVYPNSVTTDVKILSNELRLNSVSEGPLTWVAGLFYRDSEQITFQQLSSPGLPPSFAVDDKHSSTQYSVFGEATLALMDGLWELSGGGNYFRDETDLVSNLSPFTPVPLINETETKIFSPQATVAFRPRENSTIYLRYAQGFRPGTVDFGVSTFFARLVIPTITGIVGEEESESFELGAKGEFMDGTLYVEGAIFQTDLHDIQQSAAVAVPGSTVVTNTILNAGDARTEGLEWLINLTPVEGLQVSFSGLHVKAEISEDFYAPGSDPSAPGNRPLFEDGQRLNGVPELILNGQASYTWPFGSSGLDATAAATVQYSSDRALSALRSPQVLGDDIVRTDARLEIGRGSWACFAFVNNLSNEDGRVNPRSESTFNQFVALGVPVEGAIGSRLQPRTIGVGYRFQY